MSFFSYLRRSFQQFKQCKNSHSHGNANPKDICSATGPKTWTPHERVASRLAFSAIIWMLPSCFPRIYLSILLTCCKKSSSSFPGVLFLLFGDQTPSAPLGTNAASSQIEAAWNVIRFSCFRFSFQRLQKKRCAGQCLQGVKKTPSGSLHGFRFPKNSDLKQRGSCIKLRMWCNTC